MKQIIQSTKLFRFFMAKRQGVPFRTKEWYNYRAMLSKEELPKYAFIEIFDTNGKYIACPEIGGDVPEIDFGNIILSSLFASLSRRPKGSRAIARTK